ADYCQLELPFVVADTSKVDFTAVGAHRGGVILGYEQPVQKKVSIAAEWYSGKNYYGYFTPVGALLSVEYRFCFFVRCSGRRIVRNHKTTASGLLPAGTAFSTSSGHERSWFGNPICGSAIKP